MIVTYKEDGWDVITQRAHGILAAQIGYHWKAKEQPARWCETVLAIAEHDDAEVELSGEKLLTATGGPLDYSMKTFDLAHCRMLSMLTMTKSSYISLLTSLHMDFLYAKDATSDPKAKAFLKEQKLYRSVLARRLKIHEADYKKLYSILEWCDALSLLLCKGLVQPEKRIIEISTGPDERVYHLQQISEGMLTIEPWPFDTKSLELYVEKRSIPKLSFASALEFRDEFKKADTTEMRWYLQQKSPKASARPSKSKKL